MQRFYEKMNPSLLWGLILSVSSTSQLYTTDNDPIYDNFTKAPFFFSKGFVLRRKRLTESERAKRATLPIIKLARVENFCYYIDFDVGNPPQHVVAELNLKHRGTYIVSTVIPDFSLLEFLHTLYKSIHRDGIFKTYDSYSYKSLAEFDSTDSGHYGNLKVAYGKDDIFWGLYTMEKTKFMVIQYTIDSSMIGLGLSPETSNYISEDIDEEESTNLFIQMKERGWSVKSTFSLWIGSEAGCIPGVFLFNSVDYSYASSDMYIFPLLVSETRKGYYIKLDGINIMNLDGSITELVKASLPIELDFQAVYTSLPAEIVKRLYTTYNVAPQGTFKVSCDNETQKGSLALVFSGVQIVFQFKDILPECQRGEKVCNPPINPGTRAILGSNFLSILYMVFDLDRREVGLALVKTGPVPKTWSVCGTPILKSISGITAPFYNSTALYNTYSFVTSNTQESVG